MAILYQATFTTDSDGLSSDIPTIVSNIIQYGEIDETDDNFSFNDGISAKVVYNNMNYIFGYGNYDNQSYYFSFGEDTIYFDEENNVQNASEGYRYENASFEIIIENSTQSGEGFLSKTGLEYLWAKLKAYFQAYIDEREPAIEVDGDWHYRIYNDGSFEAWYGKDKVSIAVTNSSGSLYRSNLLNLVLPTNLTNQGTTEIVAYTIGVGHNNYPVWATVASKTATQINYYVLSGGSRNASPNYIVNAYVYGLIS